MEERIRSRNDLAYAAATAATTAAPQAAVGAAGFLTQVREALGKDVPTPARRDGEDLLAWKRRVVDALFETYTTLHDNLLSQTHLTGGASQETTDALNNLKNTVKISLSKCSGFDNALVGRLQESLQALQDTNNRLRGGDVVDAKTLNETLQTAIGTLTQVAVNIRKQRKDAQQTAIESDAHPREGQRISRGHLALQRRSMPKHWPMLRLRLGTELRQHSWQNINKLRQHWKTRLGNKLLQLAAKLATATAAKTDAEARINDLTVELANTRELNSELTNKEKTHLQDHNMLQDQLTLKQAEIKTLKAELIEEQKQCNVEDGALTRVQRQGKGVERSSACRGRGTSRRRRSHDRPTSS